jgi:hypothetical protein
MHLSGEGFRNDFRNQRAGHLGCDGRARYFAHSNRDSEFDLTDLITNKNKVDNAKFCQIGAFFISSWVVFYMTLKNALTEWAFGLYMASWVGARAISLIAAMRTKKEEPAP